MRRPLPWPMSRASFTTNVSYMRTSLSPHPLRTTGPSSSRHTPPHVGAAALTATLPSTVPSPPSYSLASGQPFLSCVVEVGRPVASETPPSTPNANTFIHWLTTEYTHFNVFDTFQPPTTLENHPTRNSIQLYISSLVLCQRSPHRRRIRIILRVRDTTN